MTRRQWILIAIAVLLVAGSFGSWGLYRTRRTADSTVADTVIGERAVINPEDIISDPDTGFLVVKEQMLVTFRETLTDQQCREQIAAFGGEVVGYLAGMNDYEVRVAGKTPADIKALLARLREHHDVAAAVPNRVSNQYRGPDLGKDPEWKVNTWNGRQIDPLAANWPLRLIRAPGAWDHNNDLKPVKVGVIDTWVEKDHPDLQMPVDHLLLRERPQQNAAHGTHVAGIIGAIANNAVGTTGIIWNRDLYFASAANRAGRFTDFDVKYAIMWLLARQVRVINMSFGIEHDTVPGRDQEQEFIEAPRQYWSVFLHNILRAGHDPLFVQAAGNGVRPEGRRYLPYRTGCALDWLDCGIDARWSGYVSPITDPDLRRHVIVVGSYGLDSYRIMMLQPTHIRKSPWSNFGPQVEIMAPGEEILSTLPDGYGTDSGTSMAAPMVTGVAGLVWGANPSLTAAQVKEIILRAGSDRTIGYKDRTYPLLNAEAAVETALATRDGAAQPPPPRPKTAFVMGNVTDSESGKSVEMASVSLYEAASDEYVAGGTTLQDGLFTIGADPGLYRVIVWKPGFIPLQMFIKLTDGVTVNSPYLQLIPVEVLDQDAGVWGMIKDATTKKPVSGLTLGFRPGIYLQLDDPDWPLPPSAHETKTDSNGRYSVRLPAGIYTVEIRGEGYRPGLTYVTSAGRLTTGLQVAEVVPLPGVAPSHSGQVVGEVELDDSIRAKLYADEGKGTMTVVYSDGPRYEIAINPVGPKIQAIPTPYGKHILVTTHSGTTGWVLVRKGDKVAEAFSGSAGLAITVKGDAVNLAMKTYGPDGRNGSTSTLFRYNPTSGQYEVSR